jgi:hypothetical protein
MMGCTLTQFCERIGRGIDAVGVIAIVWRGEETDTEVGMSFNPGFRIADLTDGFHQLGGQIIEGKFPVEVNKSAQMIATATGSDYVVLVGIYPNGGVRVMHNQPYPGEGPIKRLGVEPHGLAGALLREIASQVQRFN